ncbi:MAG: DMT family transporter [Gordonibacter sp.]
MNSEKRQLPRWIYAALLIAAAAIWGLSTVVIKDTVASFPPGWLVGIRFLAAGIVLSVALLPRMVRTLNADHLKTGALLGVFVGMSYLLNSTGLAYTTASKSSFLTATYCVLVPFLSWAILHKRPSVYNISAAAICILGVGLVSLQSSASFSLGLGDSITLASALFLGAHLALTSKLAPGRDILVLTALQFIVAGLMGLAWGAVSEPWPTSDQFSPDMLFNLAYMVLAASCIALLLQNIGLAHIPPAPASLFLATESVFGVAFSVLLLGEVLSSQMVFGFILIFFAIMVSEYFPTSKFMKRVLAKRQK